MMEKCLYLNLDFNEQIYIVSKNYLTCVKFVH